MSAPLRAKRNFNKPLALSAEDDHAQSSAHPRLPDLVPMATRPAPTGPPGKKRPPKLPVDLDADSGLGGFGMGKPLPRPLPLGGLNEVETPTQSSMSTGGMGGSLTSAIAKLDLRPKAELVELLKDLKEQDFEKKGDLGHGNGGSVIKVKHIPSGMVMAKKIVFLEMKQEVRKQIQRELSIMHDCVSPYIINFYGCYIVEPRICICMEYMDKGSFDGIYKKIGAVDIRAVCLVAQAVLEGLTYLYDHHRILHRDIKPSNILFDSSGSIKLCDFGVSGELSANSLANTFVGTSIYMSPERIQGAEYSVKSDIWSLGITLIELATGRFPFCDVSTSYEDEEDDFSDLEGYGGHGGGTPTHRSSFISRKRESRITRRLSRRVPPNPVGGGGGGGGGGGISMETMSVIELMQQIVREPAPTLDDGYPEEAKEFVDACLMKDTYERQTPKTLLEYRWMDDARDETFDLCAWARTF